MEKIFAVEKFLAEELNLSRKEIALYINLVKHEDGLTILKLAELSGVNRATTHVNIENLTQKGLVTQIKKGRGSKRVVLSEPPEKLAVIFKERKAKIEAAEDQLDFITGAIKELKQEQQQGKLMDIRRYNGYEEIKLIYEDVLKAREIRSYLNYKELIKVFPANTMKFLEAQEKHPDLRMWEIMEDSKEAREYAKRTHAERYFCKLTSQKLDLDSLDYMLFDGKIAIIDLAEGENINGVIIENETFYNSARSIHKFVWQLLPQFKA